MTIRPKDVIRMLENIKKASEWKNRLTSTNNLFHQGPSQYSAAVNQYGKIIEILLRHLFQEISIILPPKERTNFLKIEADIGRGRPFGNFGLGQTIDFFSQAGIFSLLNNFLGENVFSVERLNEINSFRVDQTHYDEYIIKDKVDDIRKDVTNVLLKLELIAKDPDEIVIRKKEAEEPSVQQKRMESLQRILTKIRFGLIEKRVVEKDYEIDKGEGWYGHVEIKGEIIGACLDKDETFVILVRVLEAMWPVDEEDDAYETLGAEVQKIVENIAPETKEKLEILFFSETNGSRLEESAYAYWNVKEGIVFN